MRCVRTLRVARLRAEDSSSFPKTVLLQQLFGGEVFAFGSPVEQFHSRAVRGLYHPRVQAARARLAPVERRLAQEAIAEAGACWVSDFWEGVLNASLCSARGSRHERGVGAGR